MQSIGHAFLSLQRAVFAFESKLELLNVDIETCRLLHLKKKTEFKDACTSSDPTLHFDLKQLTGITANYLQSFEAHLGQFRERTCLFQLIAYP